MVTTAVKDSSTLTKVLVGIIVTLVVVLLWLTHPLAGSRADFVDTSSLVVSQVRDVSELTTATFEMDTVVPVSEKGLLILESKLLYIAHGSVRVGVNLNEFQADDVQVEGDKITLTLPPLKILDSKLDLEHSSVYSYDRGFLGWGPDVLNLQVQAQREAIQKVEKAACQDWLIKEASDRVEKTINNLLNRVFKDKGYTIIVKSQPPTEGSCSSSQLT